MRHDEYQYLDLLDRVLQTGDKRIDRTSVGTLSQFGAMLRFDMSDGRFPVLTTKHVAWKLAVKEMLWFLSGETNIRPLLLENVRIWSDWPFDIYRKKTGATLTLREFENQIVEDPDFAAQWGDLGPVYGKQWRRWVGADGRAHDQISNLIDQLRHTPASRRMIFHGWNVSDLDAMALPPCHMVYQYHVSSEGRLNCLLFQRSADLFLGVPFNFIGAAALLRMLAQQAGLEPGELVWVGGDVHIYLNHLDQVREQIARTPRPFPKLSLLRKPESIDDYVISDFQLEGYDPHGRISAPVAV